jgi:RNA polymerase sigma factor FliA
LSYDKDSLIVEHLSLARDIAIREWRTATHVLKQDDMISLAYMGLVDAADRWEPYCAKNEYDPSATQYFKVFASLRIRGTIRDHIRKEDWATRTVRSKAKLLKNAGQDEGLPVQELADKTGLSVAEINKVNARLSAKPVSLEAHFSNNDSEGVSINPELRDDIDTEGSAFSRTMISIFVDTLKQLPFEVQVILSLKYYKNLELKRVAEELELPEARISQLHASGVLAIKSALTEAAKEQN